MRMLHVLVGIATLLVFLGTGVELRVRVIDLDDQVVRHLLRANHVYVLLAGLVNAAIGLHVAPSPERWRRRLQLAGSALLVAAPAILLVAYFVEPQRPSPVRLITAAGIFAVLIGVGLHVPGRCRA